MTVWLTGCPGAENCIEWLKGELPQPVAQDDQQAVYARKLSKAEAELDWNQPAEVLQRKVRAFNPWPVAWCEIGGQRLRIWQAEVVDMCSDATRRIVADRQS